jgi:hypothetical protein
LLIMFTSAKAAPPQWRQGCEGNRQRVPDRDEKRRIIRAMRGIKRRADGSGEETRRRPGKSWMFRRSLPQTEQNSRKRRQAEERDGFQAEQRIGSDQ